MEFNLLPHEYEMFASLTDTNRKLFDEFGERVMDIDKQFITAIHVRSGTVTKYKYRSEANLARIKSDEFFDSFRNQKMAIEAYYKHKQGE